jgi:hypothetical protein
MDDGMVRGGWSDLHQAIWEIIAQWEQESRNWKLIRVQGIVFILGKKGYRIQQQVEAAQKQTLKLL